MKKFLYEKTALGRYLISKQQSAYDFSKYSLISLTSIYKILHGHDIRIDVAKKVARATKKAVTLGDLGY